MTKATICRLSRLIRNAKRSSSIHSFLFFFNLLIINRHRIGKSVSEYPFRIVFIRYRRCNNNNRVAASLVVVLATSCVGCIQLNHKYKTLYNKMYFFTNLLKFIARVSHITCRFKSMCIKCVKEVLNFYLKKLSIIIPC